MIRTTLYSLVVLALISLTLAGDAAVQLSPRCGSFPTKSFDEKETADLIAHIMGLTPLHPKISRANFPAADLFARPNSNLLVTVDGIGTDILSQLVPSALRFFAASSSQVALLTQEIATSRSSLASVMTLVTGETPSAHGIFGRTWTSPESPEELSAFNSAYSRVPSISDLLLTSLPESTVIAVSTDRQLASALSPHPQISTHDNTHVVYLDPSSGSFISNSGVEQLSRQEILNHLQNENASFLPADAQLEFIDSSNVRVTLGSRVVASFDLTIAQDFGLFAELVAISKIVPSLITRKQTTLACDLISIGVASIRPLEERYGPGSSQVLAALYLMDAALSELSSHLEVVYEQQTTRQTLLLGTSVLAGNIKARSTRAVLDTLATTNSSTNTTYTPQQVADYQISIWGSVFIVIALFVPIYTFFNMDTSSDSILYRVAGPRLS